MPFLYQLFYDEKTKGAIKGFIPYDNTKPEQNDWFEYSAIRDLILNGSYADDDYVSILSPRFSEKTGMTYDDLSLVLSMSDADVVSFSPLFSHNVLFINSFVQAEHYHSGFLEIAKPLYDSVGLGFDLKKLCQDQTRTIYSNFFVAKYKFWKIYIYYSELLYKLEANDLGLSPTPNDFTAHRGVDDKYKFKVFIMERLINLVLEKLNTNAAIGLNYEKYSLANPTERTALGSFLLLDALKSQYRKTKRPEFLEIYHQHRAALLGA